MQPRSRRTGWRGRKGGLLLAALLLPASTMSAADVLVPAGSAWNYLDDGSDQGTRWREPAFDDGLWPSGPAQFGYGEGDETTTVGYGPDPANKHITTYFRHAFDLDEAPLYSDLNLKILRDDGAVVYLNGAEVYRSNMPSGPVAYDTPACCAVGGSYEGIWQKLSIDRSQLRRGSNLLAVEIHQHAGSSSDLSFDLVLEAVPAESLLEFVWSGALTPTSIRVHARTLFDSPGVRLHVGQNADLSGARVSAAHTASEAANHRVVSFAMQGLIPATEYYYAIEVDGEIDLSMRGHFTTPVASPFTFTFAFASCSNTGSTHPVFSTVLERMPLFFLHMGDFHNEDISVNEIDLFRAAYDIQLETFEQARLYRAAPIAYMWDDHDFGPDDADCNAPGRVAARLAYQEYVPHYPLPAGSGDVPVYQAFSIGRVRFIVTDARSERSPFLETDNPDKSMLGRGQKAWFKDQLLAANGIYPVIVWVNTIPWIGTQGHEDWSRYSYERQEIADFVKDNAIQGLFMISGDAHMLAIDDGTNSDYATGGGAPIPVMHAAALDATPHVKGGPYSEGAYSGRGQFGLMTVVDDGVSPVCVEWSGRDWLNQEVVSWSRCADAPPPADTDGDGIADVADCAFADPSAWGMPQLVTDLRLDEAGSEVLLSWGSQVSSAGPSVLYDIIRGELSDLRDDGGFERASCFVSDHPDTPCPDPSALPDPGQAEYFLLRASNPCGSSGFGPGDPSAPRWSLEGELPCALP